MNDNEIVLLLEKKDYIRDKIEYIETNYEGLVNEENSRKMKDLVNEQDELVNNKTDILNKLSVIDFQLRKINQKIRALSGNGIEKILDGIEKQRWFFFKNKPKVVLDKYTGILWANLDYYKFYNSESSTHTYAYDEALKLVETLDLDGYKNWAIPTSFQIISMIDDKTFPFQEGNYHRIKNLDYWFATDGDDYCIDLDNYNMGQANVYLLPCNTCLTSEEYERNVMDENRVYTLTEKLQFTLDIFVNNSLEPIFDSEEANEYYQNIYVEKKKLLVDYSDVCRQINKIENQIKLSSVFDYRMLLEEFNLDEINNSIFKYYEACGIWIDKLINMIDFFENEKSDITNSINSAESLFKRKYEYSFELNSEENEMLENRIKFFNGCLSLSTADIKDQLKRFKMQTSDFNREVEEINKMDNSLIELSKLENRERVSFAFFAENTNNIVKSLFKKSEKYEMDKRKFGALIKMDSNWNSDYKLLKTSYKIKYKNICEREGISSLVWSVWFREWSLKRKQVEELLLPLLKKELVEGFNAYQNEDMNSETSISEQLINALQIYKDNIDDFYTNKRKDIYTQFSEITNGDLQENVAVSKDMIRFTSFLKGNIENINKEIESYEDRLFVQKWIKPIVEIRA